MAKSLQEFRQFVVSNSPNISKADLAQLDEFVKQKSAEQVAAGGVPIENIETSDPVKLALQAQQVQAGTYKPVETEKAPAAKDMALAQSGLKNLEDVKKLYSEDPYVLAKQLIPGKYFSRKFDTATYDMADALLRLRTGAQANPSEIKGYMKTIAPSFGDSPEVVAYKLMKLERDLSAYTGNKPNITNKKVGKYTIEAIE